jgi:LPS-assembly lipoprotein
MQRRKSLLLLSQISLSAALLTGCGFKLRGSQNFAFSRIAVLPQPGGPMAIELRRTLARSLQVLAGEDDLSQAQVVLDILQEQREKVVVGVNSAGQVREFQLRSRLKFRLRTPSGQELVPAADIVQKRDISFNESAALAKGAEEDLLYRDMQTDIVQQLLRRLATVDHAARP